MANKSVSWKEGMFLMPQHFQCQELHFERLLAESAFVNHPYAYGFSRLEIDADALSNWHVALNRATGRTRLGHVFDFQPNEIARLDLQTTEDGMAKQRLERNEKVRLFLAFPLNRPNVNNISQSDQNSRYHEFEDLTYDLHDGQNEKQIVFKALRAILTTDNNRPNDFDYLQIAELELAGSEVGQIPKISANYQPACTISTASEQARAYYRSMADQLGAYLHRLIDYLDAVGFNIGSIADQDLAEPIYRYIQLSELHAWLSNQINSAGFHPYTCYNVLCCAIGRLSIVDPIQERMVNYSVYDHDNLYKSLSWAWKRITNHFVAFGDQNIKRIPLVAERMKTESGEEFIMKATIPPELFETRNWTLYLAFDTKFGNMANMSKEDRQMFTKYLTDAKVFYWKLGSHDKINRYFVNREQGVAWENATGTKPGLARRGGWYYADISRDEYWNPVVSSGTLCLRIDQGNLQTPASDLGTEKITVGIEQRTFQYRVSVFAVRKKAT